MDLINVVSNLWSKISDPLTNFFIGVGFLVFSEGDLRLISIVPMSIALAAFSKFVFLAIFGASDNKKIKKKLYSCDKEKRHLIVSVLVHGALELSQGDENFYSCKELEVVGLMYSMRKSDIRYEFYVFNIPIQVKKILNKILENDSGFLN